MAKYKQTQNDDFAWQVATEQFPVATQTIVDPEIEPVVGPSVLEVVEPEVLVPVVAEEPVKQEIKPQIELVSTSHVEALVKQINDDYIQALQSVRNPVEISISRLLLRAVTKYVNKK